jgi:hypothetical protein
LIVGDDWQMKTYGPFPVKEGDKRLYISVGGDKIGVTGMQLYLTALPKDQQED